jgi:hypothetical protein
LILLSAVALVVIGGIGFIRNLSEEESSAATFDNGISAAGTDLPGGIDGAGRSVTSDGLAVPGNPYGYDHALVILQPMALNLSERTLVMTLRAYLGRVAERLIDVRTGKTIPDIAKSDFAQSNLTVVIGTRLVASGTTFTASDSVQKITIPLVDSDFFGNPLEGKPQATFNIPLLWNPEEFPNDIVYTAMAVDVLLPAGITALGGQTGVDGSTSLPAQMAINMTVGNQLGGQVIHVAWSNQLSYILIRRDTMSILFIYSVALVPLLLFALLAHLIVVTRKEPTTATDLISWIIAVAATSLTVLPLRAVLVPANISSMTRLDFLLGLELLLLISLVVYRYWTFVIRRLAAP